MIAFIFVPDFIFKFFNEIAGFSISAAFFALALPYESVDLVVFVFFHHLELHLQTATLDLQV
jgi:hypothetical protein